MSIRWNQVAVALVALQTSLLAGGEIGTAYTIQGAGLNTPEFLNNVGRSYSAGVSRVGDRFVGSSLQYFGNANAVGAVPYVHNISTGISVPIGLTDSSHTGPDGRRGSWVSARNALGYLVGIATRYSPSGSTFGSSAWAHDVTTGATSRIGFFDAAHTASDGFQFSDSQQMGPSVWAAGFSRRYSGAEFSGQTAWVYNMASGAIREVGLTGPEFAGPTGGTFSRPVVFARTGLLIGQTDRFVGTDPFYNAAAWVHDPTTATTRRIGLTDFDHTAPDGSQYSRAQHDFTGPPSALMFGESARRNGYGIGAVTSWTYDRSNDTLRVYDGLTGSPFMSSTGMRSSFIADITQSGFVTGQTRRYGPGDQLAGSTPWLHNPLTNQTTAIGLIGPDYTTPSTGYQDGWLTGINEAGQVAGQAIYKPDVAYSYRAWFYSPNTDETQQIGIHFNDALVNPAQVRNEPRKMNESGYVIGRGKRFVDGVEKGLSGWLFDPFSNTTTELVFSTRADGYAYSEAQDVNADGFVAGVYTRYNGMSSEGNFPFYWSAHTGLIDVGSLIQGGLAANGWERLGNAQLPGDDGLILGSGTRLDGSYMPFVLQIVPEPNAAIGLFLVSLAATRRRRR